MIATFHVFSNSVFTLVSVTVCAGKFHHLLGPNSPTRARAASFLRFLDCIRRHTTIDGTPLDEGSALRRDLYLTTQHLLERTINSPGFEPAISASDRPHTLALDARPLEPVVSRLQVQMNIQVHIWTDFTTVFYHERLQFYTLVNYA
jgi:hypothetical protein